MQAGRVQLAQPVVERRFVLRRHQLRREDQIRRAPRQRRERLERPLGGLCHDELHVQPIASDGGDARRLTAVRFDGEDERHYVRVMKSTRTMAARPKMVSGAYERL